MTNIGACENDQNCFDPIREDHPSEALNGHGQQPSRRSSHGRANIPAHQGTATQATPPNLTWTTTVVKGRGQGRRSVPLFVRKHPCEALQQSGSGSTQQQAQECSDNRSLLTTYVFNQKMAVENPEFTLLPLPHCVATLLCERMSFVDIACSMPQSRLSRTHQGTGQHRSFSSLIRSCVDTPSEPPSKLRETPAKSSHCSSSGLTG